MDKEEILKKSREENKKQAAYEKEVIKQGGNNGAIVAAILATVFFVVQIFLGEGMNYGLYAVVFSIPMTGFITKAVKLKKKHEIIVAVIYAVCVVLFSVAHIMQLVNSSVIL